MNRQIHAISGVFAACIVSVLLIPIERLDFYFFWLYLGLAYLGAILPDIIEPPTSYLHRAFFHSWGFLVLMLLVLALGFVIGYDYGYFFLFFFALGYVIHLLEDATTPMGLPRL
jgi:membrane-bound metal-dependent hydrolase YbcI (DUF457 family)